MAQQEAWGLLIAVGRGQQLVSGAETAFLGIGNRPALAHCLGAFDRCAEIDGVVVVAARERMDAVQAIVRRYGGGTPTRVIPGFLSHRASLRAGLSALDVDSEWVVVHDTARPCITPAWISAVVAAARRYGNGVTAAQIFDPVGLTQGKALRAGSVCPDAAWVLQTPQCYKRGLLENMLKAADKAKLKAEDAAAALPLVKEQIRLVPCATANIRLNTPDDLAMAANLLT